MSSVLVVVIVGVIIVAITASAVRGGPKPATPPEPSHRAAHRRRARNAGPGPPVQQPVEWGVPEAHPVPEAPAPGGLEPEGEPVVPRPWAPPPAAAAGAEAPAPLDLLDPDDVEVELEPGRRGRLVRRLRAAALLALTVVLLGALAAAVLGATILVGGRVIDRALG